MREFNSKTITDSIKKMILGESIKEQNNVPNDLKQYISSFCDKLTIEAETQGSESEITGTRIANWIEPLHFEINLNEALDALEGLDVLMKEIRNHKLIYTRNNYFTHMFKQNAPDSDEFKLHKKLVEKLELDSIYDNLWNRWGIKYLDLNEYTKAAKLGAKLLFNIENSQIEYRGSDLEIVNQIRESLRSLLLEYEQILKKNQEIIVPVSLKFSINKNNNSLVEKWTDTAGERDPKDGLKQTVLKFDLNDFSEICDLKYQRIRNIGVQILDHQSLYSMLGDNEDTRHPNFWNMRLEDKGEGFPLGNRISSDSYRLSPILFYNTSAKEITWSRNNTIINLNANRKWELTIIPNSHNNAPLDTVRDIVIHFELAIIN